MHPSADQAASLHLDPQANGTKHYAGLSDEQLLKRELSVDDPSKLSKLVSRIPDGPEETYIEFAYDMRGSGRQEQFQCVHGHRHLAGIVMRKGAARFLVGWQCALEHYGVVFGAYKADFTAAQNRKTTLIRRQEIVDRLVPLLAFLREDFTDETLSGYDNACAQLLTLPAFITDRAPFFPDGEHSPRAIYEAALVELINLDATLRTAPAAAEVWKRALQRLPGFERQVLRVIVPLEALVDFLQPSSLIEICDYANRHDMSPKRRYEAGLMSLTCHRQGKDTITIRIPPSFRVPDKERLATLIQECANA